MEIYPDDGHTITDKTSIISGIKGKRQQSKEYHY